MGLEQLKRFLLQFVRGKVLFSLDYNRVLLVGRFDSSLSSSRTGLSLQREVGSKIFTVLHDNLNHRPGRHFNHLDIFYNRRGLSTES